MTRAAGMWTRGIAYDSDEYRAWNRDRMRRRRAEEVPWDARYEASFKGWERKRRYALKGQREAIVAKLAELELAEKELLATIEGNP